MKEYIVRCENNKFTVEGEIVRCKECKHCLSEIIEETMPIYVYCDIWKSETEWDAFCKYGENSEFAVRPKGEWKYTMTHYPYCSECEWMPEEDEMTHGLYNYCPDCGADMRDDNNE